MANWGRNDTIRFVSRWARAGLGMLAFASQACGLYVSERELDDGGPPWEDGSTTSGDGGSGCLHPESRACDYRFKRELTFNAQFLSEVLNDFPVLVTLDETRIDYTQTQAGGADLRFVDEDGALLAHEIERWQPGGVSVIWVRIPRFDPGTRKTISYFYGSKKAKALSSGSSVFTDYEAVYHFAEAIGPGRVIRDALGRHDGKGSGAVNANALVEGRIGEGLALLSGGQYVELAGFDATRLNALTIELWVRETDPRAHARLFCRDIVAAGDEPAACLGLDNGRAEVGLTTQGPGGNFEWHAFEAGADEMWTHLAMVWDGRTQRVRVVRNGSELGEFSHAGPLLADSLLPWVLGDRSAQGAGFSGVVDELRIAHVARSTIWLRATSVIVSEGPFFKDYGPEQEL